MKSLSQHITEAKAKMIIRYNADSSPFADEEVNMTIEDAQKHAVKKLQDSITGANQSVRNRVQTFWATFTYPGQPLDEFEKRVKIDVQTGAITYGIKKY